VSPWVATSGSQGATVSGNVTASPDGTTNADKLIEAAVTGNHFCLQGLTLTSGTTYTASFFVKASERTRGVLRTSSGLGIYWDMEFNLTSGTVTGGTNPFIQNFGNGWYRIGATFTANQASNNFILYLIDASGTASYTGDGTSGLFVFGAQVEVGSVATSYIPTTTAAVTRNADVISVTGAVSGCIGQTEGTIYAEVDYRNLGAAVSIITLQTASYTIGAVRVDTNTLNQIRVQIRDALGSGRLDATFTDTSLSTGINKIAVGYSSNASGVVFALNGSIVATTTVGASFGTLGANRVYLGTRETSASNDLFFNNRIRAAALYTTRLTNAELAALTTL